MSKKIKAFKFTVGDQVCLSDLDHSGTVYSGDLTVGDIGTITKVEPTSVCVRFPMGLGVFNPGCLELVKKAPKVLTLGWARKQVAKVKRLKNDSEAAHGVEDDMREEFLKALAVGAVTDSAGIAKILLKTSKIGSRWFA